MNERLYELKAGLGRVGANIQDCDGTVCGGEVCGEKGLCSLEKSGVGYSCNCTEPYTGKYQLYRTVFRLKSIVQNRTQVNINCTEPYSG